MRVLLGSMFTLLLIVTITHAGAAGIPAPWSEANPEVTRDIQAGHPLVVHVIVPLCDNALIDCGSAAAGKPESLGTNLYWGALFGAKRIFGRKHLGYELVSSTKTITGVLERVVFRRYHPGQPWGHDDRVEQLIGLDAIDGKRIDEAVQRFWLGATEGTRLTIDDRTERRTVTVHVTGFAGHNRLMDDKSLPALRAGGRSPTASFVMACESAPYFSPHLQSAGSQPLVMTQAYMAPEGYTIEAMARALARNDSPAQLRAAVVVAYAKWQRISIATANALFAPAIPKRP